MYTTNEKIAEFITYCRLTKNLGEKTLTSYKADLMSFNKYETSNKKLNVVQYVSLLLGSNHKTSTIKRHIASLSQYFKYVYRNNRLANPMLSTDIRLKAEKKLPKTISVYEMKKLFRVLYECRKSSSLTKFKNYQITRDLALLDLISATGIRIGEAAAMRLCDIDMKSRIILIHGKGRKERLIYLSCGETVENLKAWLTLRKVQKPDSDYVFLNRYRAPLTIYGIENIFNKYREAARINPDATPHYLRHTFATNLLANGSDLRSVQEILGHSNISITERYTEVTTNRKIKVLKKFNYRNNLLV